jgi:phosphatidylglycerol---prolipoprotein diacylglyceryl transferase
MLPILFNLGIPIHSYGVLVAVAFWIGIKITLDRAQKAQVDTNMIMNLFFVILLSSIAGARLLHVVENWGMYRHHLADIVMVHRGGLSYFGGFSAAVVTGILVIRIKGMPILKTVDLFIPALALGQSIGRLGCFFNGCCYGIVHDGPWSLLFPRGSAVFGDHVARGWVDPSGMYSLPVLPTQLLSSFTNLALFTVLVFVDARKKRGGTTFFTYLVGYGLLRFGMEFLRDDSPAVLASLSLPQVLCVLSILVGVWAFILRRIRTP